MKRKNSEELGQLFSTVVNDRDVFCYDCGRHCRYGQALRQHCAWNNPDSLHLEDRHDKSTETISSAGWLCRNGCRKVSLSYEATPNVSSNECFSCGRKVDRGKGVAVLRYNNKYATFHPECRPETDYQTPVDISSVPTGCHPVASSAPDAVGGYVSIRVSRIDTHPAYSLVYRGPKLIGEQRTGIPYRGLRSGLLAQLVHDVDATPTMTKNTLRMIEGVQYDPSNPEEYAPNTVQAVWLHRDQPDESKQTYGPELELFVANPDRIRKVTLYGSIDEILPDGGEIYLDTEHFDEIVALANIANFSNFLSEGPKTFVPVDSLLKAGHPYMSANPSPEDLGWAGWAKFFRNLGTKDDWKVEYDDSGKYDQWTELHKWMGLYNSCMFPASMLLHGLSRLRAETIDDDEMPVKLSLTLESSERGPVLEISRSGHTLQYVQYSLVPTDLQIEYQRMPFSLRGASIDVSVDPVELAMALRSTKQDDQDIVRMFFYHHGELLAVTDLPHRSTARHSIAHAMRSCH